MKKDNIVITVVCLLFLTLITTFTIGYAKYDKILSLESTVTIYKEGSFKIESVEQKSTNRPAGTGQGLVLKDGILGLDYSFTSTSSRGKEDTYTETYLLTLFNDTHQDYVFTGFNIQPELTFSGTTADQATVTVTYEYVKVDNSDLTLQDNIIAAGERRYLGIKLILYAGFQGRGSIGVSGEGEIYTSEDDSGQFYGYLEPEEPTINLQTNEYDCFSFEILNTKKQAQTFTVYPGNTNFTFVNTSGAELNSFTIGAPTEENPESNISTYTACAKAKDTSLFATENEKTSVVLSSSGNPSYSIGTVNILVNKSEEKDEEKVHIGNVTFEALNFNSTNNELNVKATWTHLPDTSGKSSSIKNYYIRLYDKNVSTTNPVYQFEVPGDAVISDYQFKLNSSNYLNETNMVNNNHSYYIKVYGIDEAGNTGAGDCNSTGNDFCVASSEIKLKYKFNLTISSTNSTVKFTDNTTSKKIYLNEEFSGTLKATSNNLNTDVTVTMNGSDLTKGQNGDYTFNLDSGTLSQATLNIFENKIKGDITVKASTYSVPCLVEGTKIRLANGKTKNIEDIGYDDLIIAVSHITGEVIYEYPIWIEEENQANSYQKITFSDGSILKTVGTHGVFSVDANEYVSVLDRDKFHVGTRVIKINEKNKKEIVTVKEIETINEVVKFYHVSSTFYHNVIADNILTTDAILIVSNMFQFNKDLTWAEEREEFIKKGDLFVYEDWAHVFPEHIFKGFRMAEAMILQHKGILDISLFDEVLNGRMKEIPKSPNGNYLWMITTSDNVNSSASKYYEAGTYYTLPKPKNVIGKKFIGWYNTADNKYYMPGDQVKVIYGMYFDAIWK